VATLDYFCSITFYVLVSMYSTSFVIWKHLLLHFCLLAEQMHPNVQLTLAFLLRYITHKHLATCCYWTRFAVNTCCCQRRRDCAETKSSFCVNHRNCEIPVHLCCANDCLQKRCLQEILIWIWEECCLFIESAKRNRLRTDSVKLIMRKRRQSMK